jgi:endo-1,4-beta-xylanase|nr:putative xylanase [uncultured bacterium]
MGEKIYKEETMKQKLRLFMLVITVLSMILVIGACSKDKKEGQEDLTINEDVDNTTENDESDTSSDEDKGVEVTTDEGSQVEDATEGEEKEEVNEETEDKLDYVVGELPLIQGGIKGVFDTYNMQAGTCINGYVIKSFSDNIIGNYNSVTMENEMKPDAILNHTKSIEAGDLVVEYPQRTIELLDFAKDNGLMVRGHTLVWYSQTPQWIFYEDFDTNKPLVDRDTMLARMDSYLKQNFEFLESKGYIDMFYAYDIVNEAINDDGSLRDCKWLEIIGDDYLWHAFYLADKYAPDHVKLYYNDYNEQFKTEAVIKMAESLVDESGRSLIDGIGCQAHLYTKDSIDKYMKTLEAFSATGLDVQITEIDVSLGTWQNIQAPTEENLREQGQYYYELVNRIIEGNQAGTTNISGITFWGVSDGVSWRSDRNPLLFDKSFKPKYAYFGVIQDKDHAGY